MNQKIAAIGAAMVIVSDITMTGCVEPYAPAVITTNANILVVDGFLNSKDGSASVKLTRTLPIYSTATTPAETKALVRIDDENGIGYVLEEKGNGLYEKTGMSIDNTQQYRLSIETVDHDVYVSEYVPVKSSPKIDSVFWRAADDGLRIYVNTTDPTNSTHYYRWECTETYEYHSAYGSIYKIVRGAVVPRPLSEAIFQCWNTIAPTEIQIGSSMASEQDAIDNHEIQYIEKGSIKISQRYSVLVRQYGITESAYNYWHELQASTEKLGSLFDTMPSEVTGNIKNTTNPERTTLGYFSAGSYEEKRIFVDWRDLPPHLLAYNPHCQMDTLEYWEIPNLPESVLLIGDFGNPPQGLLTAASRCIDCRVLGGTLTKPSFWK